LAVELARLPNGRFAVPSRYLFLHEPTDHSEKVRTVVPSFLLAVPIDPFTGRELILKKLGDGVVIYSIGSDHTDNGGRFERRGRDDPGYDLGYRLWVEEVRGRPPEG
jgi:hypothetical protein